MRIRQILVLKHARHRTQKLMIRCAVSDRQDKTMKNPRNRT